MGGFGDISKPATVLIEKISDAIGGIAAPWQTRRVAKAQADAAKIHAEVASETAIRETETEAKTELIRLEAKLDRQGVEARAVKRFLAEESQKQLNIESITRKALPSLEPDAKPQNIETDWVVNFFDKSRLVSDDEMQNLWARILAGETNNPGSYSKRTVNLCGDIDKQDAELFTTFCRFSIYIGFNIPLVLKYDDSIYKDAGLNYSQLTHLDSIGLISFSGIESRSLNKISELLDIVYFGERRQFQFSALNSSIDIGNVIFTQAGGELCKIADSKPVEGFLDYVTAKWDKILKK